MIFTKFIIGGRPANDDWQSIFGEGAPDSDERFCDGNGISMNRGMRTRMQLSARTSTLHSVSPDHRVYPASVAGQMLSTNVHLFVFIVRTMPCHATQTKRLLTNIRVSARFDVLAESFSNCTNVDRNDACRLSSEQAEKS
mmetsp:Transcript_16430/g.45547  ORF Transcript_16430/g.45547 Transcript_16430/m.45547 type:complete len:140 (-) Transcript_16430:189-608(-)